MRKRRTKQKPNRDPAFKDGKWDYAVLLNELRAKQVNWGWVKPKRTVRSPEEILGEDCR